MLCVFGISYLGECFGIENRHCKVLPRFRERGLLGLQEISLGSYNPNQKVHGWLLIRACKALEVCGCQRSAPQVGSEITYCCLGLRICDGNRHVVTRLSQSLDELAFREETSEACFAARSRSSTKRTVVSVFVNVKGIDTGYPGSVKVWRCQHVAQIKRGLYLPSDQKTYTCFGFCKCKRNRYGISGLGQGLGEVNMPVP